MAFPFAAAATIGSGLLGFLGSKSASSSAQKAAEATNQPALWDQAQPYVNQQMTDAQRLYQMGGYAPDPNQLQLQGRQNQYNYAASQMPGLASSATKSWQQGLNPGLNPYVAQMIQSGQNDLIQDFQRVTMPAIANRAVGSGGYGGGRHGIAQGLAAEGLTESLGDMTTEMLGNAYDAQQQQQRAAWLMTPSMMQAGLAPGQAQAAVGAQYQQDQMNPAMNLMGYQAATAPWTGLTGNQVAYPATQSPLWGALGGAMNPAPLTGLFEQVIGGPVTSPGGYSPNLPGVYGPTTQSGSMSGGLFGF